MKLDAHRRGSGYRLIILLQPPAYFPSQHPDYGIVSGCVPHRTMEEVDTDGALFEILAAAIQLVLDHIRQELPAAFARLEDGTVQDRIQLPQDRLSLKAA